jgi:ferredoxin
VRWSANRSRVAGNAPGKYYVTGLCIGCTLCRETTPGHFRANEQEGYGYVFKQPETPEEEGLCFDAKKACPIDAIRDDGLGL